MSVLHLYKFSNVASLAMAKVSDGGSPALQPQIHLRTAIRNGLTLFTTLGCGSFERRVELRFGCTHNHLVFVYIPLLALSMVGSPLVSFDLWLRSVWCS